MALTRPKYSSIYDTDWKQSCDLATTADVGDLFAGNLQPNSVDGVNTVVGNRILVKDQANTTQNGIYSVRVVGTGSNGWWTRSLDSNQNAFVTSGLTTDVTNGSTNAGKTYKIITTDPIYLGNTGLSFQISTATAGGANTQVQFNDNNAINGTAYFTYNKYSNVLTITGNISAANITVSGAGQFTGPYNESDTRSGVFVGNAGSGVPSPRLGFFNGNTTQNWQVDNYFGQFRWFTPGVTRMSLDPGGNLTVSSGSIISAGNVSATYYIGSGQFLSSLPGYAYSNVNVAAYLTTNNIGTVIAQNASNVTVTASYVNVAINGSNTTAFSPTQVSFLQTTNSIPYQLGSGAVYVAGGMSIAKDVWVSGNIYAGNILSTTANILLIQDSLLYLNNANTYPYNYSIGLYGHFVGGPANVYAHTAVVRQSQDNSWWFISNISEPNPATGNINVYDTNRILDNIVAGNINLIGNASASLYTGGAVNVSGNVNIGGNLTVANAITINNVPVTTMVTSMLFALAF